MKDKFFFKIIIPSYNNSVYFRKCIDVILSQTFQDYKIIIIDDNSTDDAYQIANDYQHENPDKIILMRPKMKKYAGGCRNLGLNTDIDSEYIMFIDNDDCLITDKALQRLHDNIVESGYPDCMFLNHVMISGNKPTLYTKNRIKDAFQTGAAPWKYVIRSKFSYIKFPEGLKNNEDVIWFINLYNHIDSFATTRNFIYIYNDKNTNQASRIYDKKTNDKILKLLSEIVPRDPFIEYRIEKYKKQFYIQTKQIEIEDFYNNSYVITIDDEKYDMFSKIFKSVLGYQPKRTIGYTEKSLTNPQNCTLSHLQIVKIAKLLDLPFVVIFEDDAYPRNDIENQLSSYMTDIPQDTNIIFLGWCDNADGMMTYPRKFNVVDSPVYGSQSYIIFKEAYDRYIKICNSDLSNTADGVLSNIKGCYTIDRPLFIQYSPKPSMHGHHDYIFFGSKQNPPVGFLTYEQLTEKYM